MHIAAGLLAAILGVCVLVSWGLRPVGLVSSKLAGAMRYNVALCFLIGGLGLISMARGGAEKLIRACSATILIVSGLTTVQFFIRFFFGRDGFFPGFMKNVDGDVWGVLMPANTAACFLLFGIALWRMTMPQSNRTLRGLAYLGSLILATSLVFLLGHAGRLDSA